ncbi:hypothetical protein CGOTT_08520 [Corynebacterium gottingense]|nr:hypothetical protein CGOTT_08520 [Corynebacterium gottingense]WJZ15936.1 hypothetical protein CGOTTB_08485 [Corynebacterium gottingense]
MNPMAVPAQPADLIQSKGKINAPQPTAAPKAIAKIQDGLYVLFSVLEVIVFSLFNFAIETFKIDYLHFSE